mgnify:CR=1 FL=1
MVDWPFISYLVIGGGIIAASMRVLYDFIGKLWVNHRPREEGVLLKMWLLWRNNSIISLAAVALTILYSTFITDMFDIEEITATGLAAIGILFAALNSTYRIATYAHISRGSDSSINDKKVSNRKSAYQRSYFSFLLTLLVFVYLGIGITIVSDALTPNSVINIPSLGVAFSNVAYILIATLGFSIGTEFLIWIGPYDIPDTLVDELT